MLVLTRKLGQRLRLTTKDGTEVWVAICGVDFGQVKVGIEAPASCTVLREEVIQRERRKRRRRKLKGGLD